MFISNLLTQDKIVPALKVTSKKQAFQEIADVASKHLGIECRDVLNALLERERLGSTGVGRGIAIPHAKLSNIQSLYLLFARLPNPVAYSAPDGVPVDLMVLLLTPENAGSDHLTALAKISRILRDERFCSVLRGAESPEALYSAIFEIDQN